MVMDGELIAAKNGELLQVIAASPLHRDAHKRTQMHTNAHRCTQAHTNAHRWAPPLLAGLHLALILLTSLHQTLPSSNFQLTNFRFF